MSYSICAMDIMGLFTPGRFMGSQCEVRLMIRFLFALQRHIKWNSFNKSDGYLIRCISLLTWCFHLPSGMMGVTEASWKGCAVNLVAFLLVCPPSILAVTYLSPAQSGPSGISSMGKKQNIKKKIKRKGN